MAPNLVYIEDEVHTHAVEANRTYPAKIFREEGGVSSSRSPLASVALRC
jgi:hypothetical protein